MKILITTGIFPPKIGGPAQYAKELRDEWLERGHEVRKLAYKFEDKLPTGIRHLLFFIRTVFCLRGVDFILALDTFSVGFPSVLAAKIFNKKIIIRTGGDFLWESYVERTGEDTLLSKFYLTTQKNWTRKEKIIFEITKWTLTNASAVIFSTKWQRKISESAYDLDEDKNFVVENYYGEKVLLAKASPDKTFIASSRSLKLKNHQRLVNAFEEVKKNDPKIKLELNKIPYEQFLNKLSDSYAVIVPSLSEVSPNIIFDAIRLNKPFVLTKDTGIYERIKDIAIFVDPLNEKDMTEKILFLSDEKNYNIQVEKIKNWNFTHSWQEIGNEILGVYSKIC